MRPTLCAWLVLVTSMVIATQAQATNQITGATVSVAIPQNTSYRVEWKKYDTASGALTASGQSTQGTTVGTTVNVNFNQGTVTGASPFRIEYGFTNLATGVFTRTKWLASYDTATSSANKSGGYNDNDEQVNDAGTPTDPAGTPTAVEGYKQTKTLTNDTSQPMKVRVTMRDADGNLISQREITVPPNSTMKVVNKSTDPFAVSYDKAVAYDPDTGLGTDWESLGSSSTGLGSNTAPGTYPTGGNTSTGAPTGTPSAAQSDVANQSRPGTTEGNADARQTELRKELQRIAAQVKASGDQAHSDTLGNGAKTDATNGWMKILDTDLQAIANGIGSMPGSGQQQTLEEPSADVPGEADKSGDINTLVGAYSTISGDFATLAGKWSTFTASAPLTWTVPFMDYDATVSLEGFASYLDALRLIELIGLAAFVIIAAIKILRGAFVETSAA